MRRRIDPLLVLRGLACLAVAVDHVEPALTARLVIPGWIAPALSGLGYQAVWLFFMLSSFLLTTAFLTGRFTTDEPGRMAFWKSRAWRLLPLFYFIQISVIIFALLRLYPPLAPFSLFRELGLLTCGPWIPYTSRTCAVYSLNSPLWSVLLELQFIAALPFLMRVLERSRRPHAAFVGAWAVYLVFLAFTHRPVWPRRYETHLYNAGFFALGQLLAWHKLGHPQGIPRVVPIVAAVTAVAVLYSQYLGFSTVDLSLWMAPLVLGPLFYLLILTLDTSYQRKLPTTLGGLADNRTPLEAVETVGAMSYSVYLCHKPVALALIYGLGLLSLCRTPISTGLCIGGLLLAVLAVSTPLYLFIENRFRPQRSGSQLLSSAHPASTRV